MLADAFPYEVGRGRIFIGSSDMGWEEGYVIAVRLMLTPSMEFRDRDCQLFKRPFAAHFYQQHFSSRNLEVIRKLHIPFLFLRSSHLGSLRHHNFPFYQFNSTLLPCHSNPFCHATMVAATITAPSTGPSTTSHHHHHQHHHRLSDKLQLRKSLHNSKFHKVQILGHRGALFEGVENTLEAFRSCCELEGCHGVELDVFQLKDGSLVVFHGTGGDETPGLLKEYCECDSDVESILDLTLGQVQALAFVRESEHLMASEEVTKKARIPTLQQVLELFSEYPDKRVTIELKGAGTVEPTVRLVEELQMTPQVVLSSFKHDRVRQVKQLNPSIRTAAIFKASVPTNFLQVAQQAHADEVHLRYDTCSVERVQAAHQRGFKVMAWFRGPKAMKQDVVKTYVDAVSETTVYKMVLQTGVDAICCNRPHAAVELIGRKQ